MKTEQERQRIEFLVKTAEGLRDRLFEMERDADRLADDVSRITLEFELLVSDLDDLNPDEYP